MKTANCIQNHDNGQQKLQHNGIYSIHRDLIKLRKSSRGPINIGHCGPIYNMTTVGVDMFIILCF